MKNELMETNNTGFLALQDFNLANVMSEEMDGLSATFERVKIPSGGGIMFEMRNTRVLHCCKKVLPLIFSRKRKRSTKAKYRNITLTKVTRQS